MFIGKLVRFGFDVDELLFGIAGSDAREVPHTIATCPLMSQVRYAVYGLSAQTIDDLLDVHGRLCGLPAILSGS